ncbi:Excitatory amino acid transporter 5 [Varanus komodoensis]|nr:Excitatory amino acid transporter 5 [Varanus komodoensis]
MNSCKSKLRGCRLKACACIYFGRKFFCSSNQPCSNPLDSALVYPKTQFLHQDIIGHFVKGLAEIQVLIDVVTNRIVGINLEIMPATGLVATGRRGDLAESTEDSMAVALDAVLARVKDVCKRNGLLILSVLSVIVGCLLGFFLRTRRLSQQEISYFQFPGELLMRMLKMLILPLVVSRTFLCRPILRSLGAAYSNK